MIVEQQQYTHNKKKGSNKSDRFHKIKSIVFPQGNKGYQLRGPTPFLDFNDYNGMPGKQHANNFNNKNQNRKSNNSKTR